MDPKTANEAAAAASAARPEAKQERRKRWEMSVEHVRYFLPKNGTGAGKPELGEEVSTEAEVLVQAFQKGNVFFTVVAWKAAADMSGHAPTIVKQALTPTRS